jgi:hypothetical protein
MFESEGSGRAVVRGGTYFLLDDTGEPVWHGSLVPPGGAGSEETIEAGETLVLFSLESFFVFEGAASVMDVYVRIDRF